MRTQPHARAAVLPAMFCCLLAGGVASGAELAPASTTPSRTATLDVPTFAGRKALRIANPDAARTVAWAAEMPILAPAAGGMVPASLGASIVTSRVIVRVGDERTFARSLVGTTRRQARGLGFGGRTLAGFRVIEAASVREASVLASALARSPGVSEAWVDMQQPIAPRRGGGIPTDPGVTQQWHLLNATMPGNDAAVVLAWQAGYTGAGVTVGVVDAGFAATHPDLAPNFSAAASQPDKGTSDHGTACAGLVAAAANNAQGGAGVAYDAKVSRLYYGSSSQIADALAFRNDLNAVKSNSWGPLDNARISFMSSLEQQALADAATTGRDGKGTVMVWASGNGAQNLDRVDYDAYASNRHVMAVGSVDFFDRRAQYSEPGSALFCVAPSGFDFFGPGPKIYTTWGTSDYIATFGGTSAACPIAAGVVALILDANPALTARDVFHIVARTARKCNPTDPGWIQNAAGRWINYDFGFGAIAAGPATELAAGWVNVPPETAVAKAPLQVGTPIPDNDPVGVSSVRSVSSKIRVERVQVVLTAPHPRIGDLRVTLTSPGGTPAVLADLRADNTVGAYNAYTFTSVRTWDEFSRGDWTLNVADRNGNGLAGVFDSWQLRIFGTRPRCDADWDFDGTVSESDLFAFISDYFAGGADFTLDGSSTPNDLFAFLQTYFTRPRTGC